jgi:hypothetical protein
MGKRCAIVIFDAVVDVVLLLNVTIPLASIVVAPKIDPDKFK